MGLLTHNKSGILEVGVDEAGRGPAIGRVYAAAVIWPEDLETDTVKDSKKYSKKADRIIARNYIIENALAYGIGYSEPEEIDKIGIYKAVMQAMYRAIDNMYINPEHILVDGNSFRPYKDNNGEYVDYTTVVSGDDKYLSIAAASVLAKVAHDEYIEKLCLQHPILNRYGLKSNMGYCTKTHMAALKEHGITQYHRKSFKCCNDLPLQVI